MSSERGRKPGVALLGTASDQDEANAWQKRLLDAGIQSIVRGHRADGSVERRPSFSGVDVYVPATLLVKARAVITPVAGPGQVLTDDERPFPWVWLFAVPVAVLVAAVIIGVVVVL